MLTNHKVEKSFDDSVSALFRSTFCFTLRLASLCVHSYESYQQMSLTFANELKVVSESQTKFLFTFGSEVVFGVVVATLQK